MNQKITHKWHKTVSIWILLSLTMVFSLHAAPLKIMMLGDSITEGGGAIPDTPDLNQSTYTQGLIQNPDHIGYRAKLYDLLVSDGYSIGEATDDLDFVGGRSSGVNYPTAFDMDHQAVSGYTSKQILDNIDAWLSATPADIFLLHVGTNDGAQQVPIGEDNATDQNENTTVNNVKKILASIFTSNPNAKVFLARIIEGRRAEAYSPWRTNTLNNKIEEMVNNHNKSENIKIVNMQNGAGIIYDPCGTTLGDMQPFQIHENGGIYYDFHPNHKGYEKMAKKWHTALLDSDWLPSLSMQDTTPPVITLNGADTVTYLVGQTYTELGATVTDNEDTGLTVTIDASMVDTNTVGTYTVIYTVSDSAGNKAIGVSRTIQVVLANVEWYQYNKNDKIVTISPISGLEKSILRVQNDLDVIFFGGVNALSFTHALDGTNAYIKANVYGQVSTGFNVGETNDSTLKTGTSFNLGTKSLMKKESSGQILIESTVKLAKNASLVIGGK